MDDRNIDRILLPDDDNILIIQYINTGINFVFRDELDDYYVAFKLPISLFFWGLSAKLAIMFLDWIFGYPFSKELEEFLEITNIEEPIKKTSVLIDITAQLLFQTVSYIEIFRFECMNCYEYYSKCGKKVLFWDLYHYFRYDFVTYNKLIIKLCILSLVLFLPFAIWEASEYGFPKEYLAFVPIVLYSAVGFYLTITYKENIFLFIKNSWFFQENLFIPDMLFWGEYVYHLPEQEPYFLIKLKSFYKYMFTPSIDMPLINVWEDYIYRSNHRSIIKRFFNYYIKPYLELPKKRPRWMYRSEPPKKYIVTEKKIEFKHKNRRAV